jgi:hypothetical protein
MEYEEWSHPLAVSFCILTLATPPEYTASLDGVLVDMLYVFEISTTI